MWIVCICRTMHIRGVVHRATTCRIYSKKFFLVSDVPLLPPNLIYLGGGPSKLTCHWDSPQFCNKSHIFLLSPLHCRAGLHCCLVSVHESIGLPSCVLCNLPCFFFSVPPLSIAMLASSSAIIFRYALSASRSHAQFR